MEKIIYRKIIDPDTNKIIEEYFLNNKLLHNVNGPACLIYHIDGTLESKEWRQHGLIQRQNDKPGKIKYHKNGKIKEKIWFMNNQIHRKSAPAVEQYNDKGTLICQEWINHNRLHNIYGPAIKFHQNNSVIQERYYIYGRFLGVDHPFNQFKQKNDLPESYGDWPKDMQLLYKFQTEHLL